MKQSANTFLGGTPSFVTLALLLGLTVSSSAAAKDCDKMGHVGCLPALARDCDESNIISNYLKNTDIQKYIGLTSNRSIVDENLNSIANDFVKLNFLPSCQFKKIIKRDAIKSGWVKIEKPGIPSPIIFSIRTTENEICIGLNNKLSLKPHRSEAAYPFSWVFVTDSKSGRIRKIPRFHLKCYDWSGVHAGEYVQY